MTPERFRQVRDLFEAALEQDAAGRTAWLEQACEGDLELRSEVQRLLIADAVEGDLIDQPVSEQHAYLPSLNGRHIGAYQILREIGRGGMGAVYLATRADDTFHKEVAFKVVRPDCGSADIIHRFRQEREILAGLDHPNIARLLDGGTTDEGLPYFVMEYVEGEPIDHYCDQHTLNISDRVRLFRSVCSAVQYAHQHLVVHRDLKPSNILVTKDGTVKLLDFGIAKLLRTEGEKTTVYLTRTGIHLMTPEYASPEQVKHEAITTATDVYSLGVVLYELLTGHRPYRMKGRLMHEVARVICEEDPTRPSTVVSQVEEISDRSAGPITITPQHVSAVREGGGVGKLKRRLSGDLDNIVLMALRKEPHRRYSAVEKFSEDLQRHLDGLPVAARNDTVSYRTGKFLLRHRVGVTAAMGVAVSLIIGSAATLQQSHIAHLRAAEALKQSKVAEEQASIAEVNRQRAEAQRVIAEEQQKEAELQSREANRQRTLADLRTRQVLAQRAFSDKMRLEAEAQREKAERRFRYARDLASSLFTIFDEVKDLPQSRAARLLISQKATEYLRLLTTEEREPDATLQAQLKAADQLRTTYDSPKRPPPPPTAAMPGWFLAGSNPAGYDYGLDKGIVYHGAASAYLRSNSNVIQAEFGTVMQMIRADGYKGKTIRMSAAVKCVDVTGQVRLWLRADSNGKALALNNMGSNPISGTRDWQRYEITLDASAESDVVAFGFILVGAGKAWIDDIRIEADGKQLVESDLAQDDKRLFPEYPRLPQNLDFEQ